MERSDIPYSDQELFEEIEELDENLTEEHVSIIRMTLQREIDVLTRGNNPQQTLKKLEKHIKSQR